MSINQENINKNTPQENTIELLRPKAGALSIEKLFGADNHNRCGGDKEQ